MLIILTFLEILHLLFLNFGHHLGRCCYKFWYGFLTLYLQILIHLRFFIKIVYFPLLSLWVLKHRLLSRSFFINFLKKTSLVWQKKVLLILLMCLTDLNLWLKIIVLHFKSRSISVSSWIYFRDFGFLFLLLFIFFLLLFIILLLLSMLKLLNVFNLELFLWLML